MHAGLVQDPTQPTDTLEARSGGRHGQRGPPPRPGASNVGWIAPCRSALTQNEVVKGEGITYSEELNKVYIALTRFKTSALAGSTTSTPWQYDIIGHDDIRLPDNACGGILKMDVTSTTNWRPTHGRIILAGVPQTADAQGNTCDVNNIASPDNLIMMPGTSQLFIQEDCDDHINCVGWLVDLLQKAPYAPWPANPVLTRIISSPAGAEITGVWPATVGTYTYVPMGMQHADSSPFGFVGYVGPVPNSLLGLARASRPTRLALSAAGSSTPSRHRPVRRERTSPSPPTTSASSKQVVLECCCIGSSSLYIKDELFKWVLLIRSLVRANYLSVFSVFVFLCVPIVCVFPSGVRTRTEVSH